MAASSKTWRMVGIVSTGAAILVLLTGAVLTLLLSSGQCTGVGGEAGCAWATGLLGTVRVQVVIMSVLGIILFGAVAWLSFRRSKALAAFEAGAFA